MNKAYEVYQLFLDDRDPKRKALVIGDLEKVFKEFKEMLNADDYEVLEKSAQELMFEATWQDKNRVEHFAILELGTVSEEIKH